MQIVIPVLVFEPVIFHSQDVVVKKMQALSLCVEFCALCDILLHGFSFVNENLQALKYRRRGKTDSHRKNVRKIFIFTISHLCQTIQLFSLHKLYFISHWKLSSKPRIISYLAELKGSSNYPLLNEMLPPTANAIKSLAHCHSQLCDIIERVNQVYQIQNLLGIIVCTLKMLPHLFLTGIILTYSNFKILHISFFLWPAQYLYRVFIVCNSATKVTTEVSVYFI